jgi:AraC family transcriptional regulator of adaptative response/methylated-DNA-[protein]-cysteine methyltransferase
MTDFEKMSQVINWLEKHYAEQPSLTDMAQVVGLSESHFHRLFCRWAGISPKAFVKSATLSHVKKLLLLDKDILTASLEAGLSSPSRAHDLFVTTEAVSPGEFKARGQGIGIQYGVHETPFGSALLAVTQRGLCSLAFFDRDSQAAVADLKNKWPLASINRNPKSTKPYFQAIFQNNKKNQPLSIFLMGTRFQLQVWRALLQLPDGALISYKSLTLNAGLAKAYRAVGSAVGNNPIAYLIPCHRVIKASGLIGDYRWGAERKKMILASEQIRNWKNLKHSL